MNPIIVKLLISGVCLFVPNANNKAAYDVVAPRVERATVASDGTILPAHFAYIAIPTAQVKNSGRYAMTYFDSVFNNRWFSVFIVHAAEISMSAVSDGALTTDPAHPGDLTAVPTAEQTSLDLVPDFRSVWPAAGSFRSEYLDVKNHPELAALHIKLDKGSMKTDWVNPAVWEFRPVSVDHVKQMLAQEVATTVHPTGSPVITVQEFGGGDSDPWTIELQVDPKNANFPIEVHMGNASLADIFYLDPAASHDMVDRHFELFYRLFENTNAIPPVPFRVDGKVQVRPGGANCVPVKITAAESTVRPMQMPATHKAH